MSNSSPLARAYRELRRQQSSSMIYQEPSAPAQRPSIYKDAPVRSLADRASAQVASKYEQRQGESDFAYVARLKPLLHHLTETLPAPELERVAASFNGAVQRIEGGPQTHEQLRDHLDSKADGTGRGVMGSSTPQERAQLVGRQTGQGEGHLATSVDSLAANRPLDAASVNMIIAAREAAQRGQQPQHTDVSQLRSTGAGILRVDR